MSPFLNAEAAIKKAPLGAFFIGLVCALPAFSDCGPSPSAKLEKVFVSHVHDGDTLTLRDGRRIRLLGINTPELAHDQRAAEPLAEAATSMLRALVDQSAVFLQPGEDDKDHYGRTLGHVFTVDRQNVTANLLAKGVGFQVIIPPNTGYSDCYTEAEGRAQIKSLGVWGHPYFVVKASNAPDLSGGFVRVAGRIERVELTASAIWVELEGQVVFKLDRRNAEDLAGPVLDRVVALSQQRASETLYIQGRGWMQDRAEWGKAMRSRIAQGQRKRFQLIIKDRRNWRLIGLIDGAKRMESTTVNQVSNLY